MPFVPGGSPCACWCPVLPARFIIFRMKEGFLRDLERLGPGQVYGPVSRSAAQTYCSRLARSHYENFTVASILLPRRLQRPFHAIYAWCRWADDLADEAGGGARALELLRWWRE